MVNKNNNNNEILQKGVRGVKTRLVSCRARVDTRVDNKRCACKQLRETEVADEY